MIPGKKYNFFELMKAAPRHRWTIALAFAVFAMGAAIYAAITPNLYRSEASILIVPQRVPDNYVRATVTSRIEDRLNSISQQILSHTSLLRIIEDFDLYPAQRAKGGIDDVVARMRADIAIVIEKGVPRRNDETSFRVSYQSTDAETTTKVAERLTALFIDENLRAREVLARETTQFLNSQLESSRQQLEQQESAIQEFKRRHAGELPSELGFNQAQMEQITTRIRAIEEALSRDRARRNAVERILATASMTEAAPAPIMVEEVPAAAPQGPGTAANELRRALLELRALEVRLKPEHPDVVRQKRLIARLQEKALLEAGEVAPIVAEAPRPAQGPTLAQRTRVAELEAEMSTLDQQIAYAEQDRVRLQAQLGRFQARLQASPAREAELSSLVRDHATRQDIYQNMVRLSEDSKVAADLESQRIGDQFRVIEPARLPKAPFSPDRPRLILYGVFVGLVAGLGLACVREYQDPTLRSDNDVRVSLMLPVLAAVPLMPTADDIRRQRRHSVLLTGTLAVTILVCLLGAAFGS